MLLALKFWSILPMKLSTRLKKAVEVDRLFPFGQPVSHAVLRGPRISLGPGAALAIFGVGQGLRASKAAVTELAGPLAAMSAAICEGSGTQVLPACAPFSR